MFNLASDDDKKLATLTYSMRRQRKKVNSCQVVIFSSVQGRNAQCFTESSEKISSKAGGPFKHPLDAHFQPKLRPFCREISVFTVSDFAAVLQMQMPAVVALHCGGGGVGTETPCESELGCPKFVVWMLPIFERDI